MKTKQTLLILILLFFLIGAGCDKNEFSDYVEGYIVGSFIADKIGDEGISTGKTPIGFCIILENRKNENSNYPMDFYTFNLPENIFDFPEGLIPSGCNGNDCGPIFFPENERRTYKIRFNYKDLKEIEKMNFACGACTMMDATFPWENYSEVSLKNTVNLKK